VQLSHSGSIVLDEWNGTPAIRSWVAIDSAVVMPNHCHVLVEITERVADEGRGPGWRRGVLGSVVNGVKAACTRRIRSEAHADFAWQPRFHDVIIRSEDHVARARQYIIDNPVRAYERMVLLRGGDARQGVPNKPQRTGQP
jgi:REP element-mobilizing transposase RayT